MLQSRRDILAKAAIVAASAAVGRSLPGASPFDLYVAEINGLAMQCGACDPGKSYCDSEAWREMFEDGLSPAEAWSEEVYAARQMCS